MTGIAPALSTRSCRPLLRVEDVFRGTFMRTAILSVVFAAISRPHPNRILPNTLRTAASQQKPADPPLSVLCAPGTTIPVGRGVQLRGDRFGRNRRVPVCHQRRPAGRHRAGTGHRNDQRHAYRGRHIFLYGSGDRFGGRDCHHRKHALHPATSGGAGYRRRRPPATPLRRLPTRLPSPRPKPPPVTKPPVIAPPEIDPAKLARHRAIRPSKKRPQGSPQDDHPFILGAEDQITVLVYGSPEFSGQHMIRPDGKITMPFLGDVVAAGITPSELSARLKRSSRSTSWIPTSACR